MLPDFFSVQLFWALCKDIAEGISVDILLILKKNAARETPLYYNVTVRLRILTPMIVHASNHLLLTPAPRSARQCTVVRFNVGSRLSSHSVAPQASSLVVCVAQRRSCDVRGSTVRPINGKALMRNELYDHSNCHCPAAE